MENGSFSFRNSLCPYGGKKKLPHQVFKECCKLSAWLTEFQGCALAGQNSKQGSKSSVLACWWCMLNKDRGWLQGRWASTRGLCVHGRTEQHFPGCKSMTPLQKIPCLVHRVVQGWSSAKIPTECKDKGILGKVSFIFTALICDQFLKTLLYLQNPTSRIHRYPTDLIQTFKEKWISSKTVHFYP